MYIEYDSNYIPAPFVIKLFMIHSLVFKMNLKHHVQEPSTMIVPED